MTTHLLRSTLILLGVLVSGTLGVSITARGGGSDSGLRIRIPDEMGPPGGVVQMKLLTTEVSPISGGRPFFLRNRSMFDVVGFSVFNAAGEAAGAAVIDGDRVQTSYVTTAPFAGEYPIMAVSLRIRGDVAPGTETEFTIDPRSVWNLSTLGPVTARISPGTVTVGGSVSITDVYPAEGVWPAGTVVSVSGMGFSGNTQLRVDASIRKNITVVSPDEMQFTLAAATNLSGLEIVATNPDNSRSRYFAYLRGIAKSVSSRALLSVTRPIFGVTSRAVATLGPIPPMSGSQYSAIALQNPNRGDAAVTLSLYANDGTVLHQSTDTIASRERRALEVSEWLGGVAPPAGSSIVVSASAPIDAISLLCDEGLWTVAASLPLEAQN